MQNASELLRAYDAQLRGEAEVTRLADFARLGPLFLATFGGGQGFVTYRSLDGIDELPELVATALARFVGDPDVVQVEWKTRAHDHAPGLSEALVSNGFAPEDPESIMIGEATALAVDVPLPGGVTLRRVHEEGDVRAMAAMQAEVFDDAFAQAAVDELLERSAADAIELWVAESHGAVISAGRVDFVDGTEFAGIWGGSTMPQWRGRGIYRALTAARARAAIAHGKTLVNSDSTEFSRPILERSGFRKVSTTTPYVWRREAAGR